MKQKLIEWRSKNTSYRAYSNSYRKYHTSDAESLLCFCGLFNPVSFPILLATCLVERANDPIVDKVVFIHEVVNSITVNVVVFSLAVFFILKKYIKEGSIKNLTNKDITMISFLAVPAAAILFSALITAVLYKVRESCNQEDMYMYLTRDTYLTNPFTGLIMATAALIGIIRDKFAEKENEAPIVASVQCHDLSVN